MEHPTDLALLRALEADARISFGDLGEKVGLSKSACRARVRALERAGAIRDYGADYVLQVLAPDIAALDGLLRGELAKLPGVERVTTTMCLKTIKSRGGIMPCVRRGAR